MLAQPLQIYFIQTSVILWKQVCILMRFEMSKSMKKLNIVDAKQ